MLIFLVLLIPIVDAFGNLFSKQAARSGINSLFISWSNNVLTVLLLSPSIFFVPYNFNSGYFYSLTVTGLINIAATVIIMKAISMGDLSQVIPMLSFTPLFMLISSPLIVGEMPKLTGIAGIILVVAGSYLLNIDFRSKDLLSPFRSLVKNKGTRLMLIVAFLFSITSNFDKLAIKYCNSPIQHAFFLNLFIFTGVTVIVAASGEFHFNRRLNGKMNLVMLSLMNMAGTVFFMVAVSVTYVAYIISLKRTSGMLSVLLGHFILKESGLRERILGSIIMFLGVILILLA